MTAVAAETGVKVSRWDKINQYFFGLDQRWKPVFYGGLAALQSLPVVGTPTAALSAFLSTGLVTAALNSPVLKGKAERHDDESEVEVKQSISTKFWNTIEGRNGQRSWMTGGLYGLMQGSLLGADTPAGLLAAALTGGLGKFFLSYRHLPGEMPKAN